MKEMENNAILAYYAHVFDVIWQCEIFKKGYYKSHVIVIT